MKLRIFMYFTVHAPLTWQSNHVNHKTVIPLVIDLEIVTQGSTNKINTKFCNIMTNQQQQMEILKLGNRKSILIK